MVTRAPSRFSALGAAPLQDIAAAPREPIFAVGTSGLAGIEVGSNVGGVPIGDPRFLLFFEAAEPRNAAIFVHPLRPAGMYRLVGPASLKQSVTFPVEIGLAVASLIQRIAEPVSALAYRAQPRRPCDSNLATAHAVLPGIPTGTPGVPSQRRRSMQCGRSITTTRAAAR
jgi:hypothetical protein